MKPCDCCRHNLTEQIGRAASKRHRTVAGRDCEGFSLLEVLVAFVVLSLVLGTLMQIFSGGLRNISSAREHHQALLLAQNQLASIGIESPLEAGSYDGKLDDTFTWQAVIRPYNPQDGDNGSSRSAKNPLDLYLIELEVNWGEPGHLRSISLQTLRSTMKEEK